MNDPVTESLGRFQEKDLTVKVCRLLFESLPKAPNFVFYRDLKGAMQHIDLSHLASSLQRLEAIQSEGVTDDLGGGQTGYRRCIAGHVHWGFKHPFLVLGRQTGRHGLESDRPQAIDAVLKSSEFPT